MIGFSYVFIVISFAFYAAFEAMALLARVSGAVAGKNAIAASYALIINTVKRLFIFMYPPLLGFMLISNAKSAMFLTIISSFLAGASMIIFVFIFKYHIIGAIHHAIIKFSNGSGIFSSFNIGISNFFRSGSAIKESLHQIHKDSYFKGRDIKIFLYSSIIYVLYSGSIFFINTIVLIVPKYGPILLQATAFVTGIGTLMMSFFLDPLIARSLENNERTINIVNYVLYASILAYGIICPILFIGIYYLFIFK